MATLVLSTSLPPRAQLRIQDGRGDRTLIQATTVPPQWVTDGSVAGTSPVPVLGISVLASQLALPIPPQSRLAGVSLAVQFALPKSLGPS